MMNTCGSLRPRSVLAAAAVCLFGFSPCEREERPGAAAAPVGPGRVDEELTIVVEADKSRIATEEARLIEQKKAVEEQKAALAKQFDELEARKREGAAQIGTVVRDRVEAQEKELRARERALAKQDEDLAQQREELVRQRDELIKKVSAGIGGGAETKTSLIVARESAVATREKDVAAREKDLARRERELAGRERDLAEREKSASAREIGAAPGKRTLAKGAEVSRADFEAYYKKVLGIMKAKGLNDDDLPAERASVNADILAARRVGDFNKALDLAEALDAAVATVRIDHAFVDTKLRRVESLMAKRKGTLDPRSEADIRRIFRVEVARAVADGKYSEANQALNQILGLVSR